MKLMYVNGLLTLWIWISKSLGDMSFLSLVVSIVFFLTVGIFDGFAAGAKYRRDSRCQSVEARRWALFIAFLYTTGIFYPVAVFLSWLHLGYRK